MNRKTLWRNLPLIIFSVFLPVSLLINNLIPELWGYFLGISFMSFLVYLSFNIIRGSYIWWKASRIDKIE